jgi:hypothetical protein
MSNWRWICSGYGGEDGERRDRFNYDYNKFYLKIDIVPFNNDLEYKIS